jgi:hypothetical protein
MHVQSVLWMLRTFCFVSLHMDDARVFLGGSVGVLILSAFWQPAAAECGALCCGTHHVVFECNVVIYFESRTRCVL